jgi:hypothetical protein
MTDYLPGLKGYSVPKKHRGHRRSQSVTYDDFERLQRARATPAWENTGVQQPRTAYAQFAPEAPTYVQSGHGNDQAIPVMQIPMRTQATQQQRGFEEVMSTTEPLEVSSSSQGRPPEHWHSSFDDNVQGIQVPKGDFGPGLKIFENRERGSWEHLGKLQGIWR